MPTLTSIKLVDRQGFLNWCEGILINFKLGKGVITPELDCIKAEEALNNGETIFLTVDNKIYSQMRKVNGVLREEDIKSTIRKKIVKTYFTKKGK